MKYLFLFFSIFCLPLLHSCKNDIGDTIHGNYPIDIGKIITYNCATSGCHNSQSYQAAAGLNLSSWNDLFLGSNNGSPVIPYNSSFSSLCYFTNTYFELGSQNLPTMPLNQKPLPYDDVRKIKAWVDNGAPDVNGKVMWSDQPTRKKLYAVNQGCDMVTVFDAITQLPMRCINVGNKIGPDTPHQIKVSADGKYWYVLFVNNNVLQKFRCTDDAHVADIPLTPKAAGTGPDDATDWNTLTITNDGKRAYCVSWTGSGKIAAVDLEKNKLIHYLGGQYFPHGIALNKQEDKLYVTAQTGNFMTAIDTSFSTATQFWLSGVGVNYSSLLDPHDIILSPDGENFLVTCQKSNEVRVYNIAQNKVTHVIPTGVFPQEIVYSKSTGQYYVSCTNDSVSFPNSFGVITKIDGTSYGAVKLKCGFQPHGIAVDESAKLIYVLSRNISSSGPLPHHTSQCVGRNGFVNFVDLSTFSLLPKKYELSVDPYYIHARP